PEPERTAKHGEGIGNPHGAEQLRGGISFGLQASEPDEPNQTSHGAQRLWPEMTQAGVVRAALGRYGEPDFARVAEQDGCQAPGQDGKTGEPYDHTPQARLAPAHMPERGLAQQPVR